MVSASKDTGYLAASTLAGTRLNTELKDVGAAVSVYTQEFLEDIAVTKLEDILTYTASTEAAGRNGNFSGIAGENSAEVREDPSSVNRVRALAQATRTRDFFPSDIPTDTFNFGTLTVSRGPNAILAGVGNAGGIIDAGLRKATFKDDYRLVSRLSSYGSHREELHLNKVFIPNRLAVRLELLNDQKFFRQKPTKDKDQRLYTALQYRVIDPKRDSFLGRGTFRANHEAGKIDGIPPDPLTPTFTLANWFTPMTSAGASVPENAKYQWWGYGSPLLNAPTAAQGPTSSSLRNSSGAGILPANSSVVQGFPLYAQMALIYADPTSNTAGVGLTNSGLTGVQGFQGTIPATLPGGTGGSLRSSGDFNRQRTGFVRTRLSDPNIFNFYDNLMTGVFDQRSQRFKASDLRYEQLLLGGRAGFEAAYNYQEFKTMRDFSIPTGGNDEGIMVDVNYYLSVKDSAGQPILNPNFGRPFISTTDVFRDSSNRITRESSQLTAFYKHDFTTSKSKWVSYLGRHTFTGLLFKTNIERFNRTYASTWDPASQISPQSSLAGALPGSFGTQVNGWFYVGPSLQNVANISDVRLQSITATRPQPDQTYTVRVYDPLSRTFVNSSNKPLRILQRLVDQREELSSTSVALQSQFFNNYLTTIFGWREDKDDAFTSNAPTKLANGSIDQSTVTFLPSVSQGKQSWTKSVVGRLPVRLPGETELRVFWNESGNFNPVGQRRNIWNEELGSPSANTEERGFSVSTFKGKLFLRVNQYKTNIKNDAIAGVGNPYSYISSTITAMIAARNAGLLPANFNYNYPGWNSFSDVAQAIYSTIPSRLQANIGANKNFNPNFTGSGSSLTWNPESIINLTSTSDTESTGTEFEAIVNPTRSWRISLSVSKNEAVKASVAVEEAAFAAAWKKNLDTMYGGALLPGARNPASNQTGTFYEQYVAEHLVFIRSASALSGLPSPEVRKWRANMVTRYDFRQGSLKGVNVGGAVRWQDRVGIGFPLVTAGGITTSDVTRPYWGAREHMIDLSAGYTRKINMGFGPVTWNLGLNVRNLNAKDEIIPIKANADGSWGTFRIAPERTWTVTNSFAF